MTWAGWLAAALAALEAAYMVFDGVRALVAGDYLTPRRGPHAGQLGPWARVVAAVGIHPRSAGMKLAFVAYGVAWLVVIVAFVLRAPWAWAAMFALAAGSLWYLVAGTVISAAVIVLLLLPAVRASFG